MVVGLRCVGVCGGRRGGGFEVCECVCSGCRWLYRVRIDMVRFITNVYSKCIRKN